MAECSTSSGSTFRSAATAGSTGLFLTGLHAPSCSSKGIHTSAPSARSKEERRRLLLSKLKDEPVDWRTEYFRMKYRLLAQQRLGGQGGSSTGSVEGVRPAFAGHADEILRSGGTVEFPGGARSSFDPVMDALEDVPLMKKILADTDEVSRKRRLRRLLEDRGVLVHPLFRPKVKKSMPMYVVRVIRGCHVTTSGKVNSFSATVTVGDKQGGVGLGQGNGSEVGSAVDRAYRDALKRMVKVPLFFGHTILEPVEAKFCASVLKMRPVASGMGIRANFHVANIARLAGIHDLDAKCYRSTNPMNVAKACYKAFTILAAREGDRKKEEVRGQGESDQASAPPTAPA